MTPVTFQATISRASNGTIELTPDISNTVQRFDSGQRCRVEIEIEVEVAVPAVEPAVVVVPSRRAPV